MLFRSAPLAIPTVLGIIMAVVSFLYLGIDGLISVISSDFENIRDTLIIFLLLLIGGIQLISIGIIGKYLAKTYEQSKNRPIYIAREVIEPKNDD